MRRALRTLCGLLAAAALFAIMMLTLVDVAGRKVDSEPPAPLFAEEAPLDEAPAEDVAFTDAAVPAEEDAPTAELAPEAAAAVLDERPAPTTKSSIRPVPALPSIAPPAGDFPDEQDAAAHLLRTQQRDAWVARAEWLRAEAEALDDKHRRPRALLAVSELFAMAGEEATAKQIAEETRELAPSMALAHQQVRAVAGCEQLDQAVGTVAQAQGVAHLQQLLQLRVDGCGSCKLDLAVCYGSDSCLRRNGEGYG